MQKSVLLASLLGLMMAMGCSENKKVVHTSNNYSQAGPVAYTLAQNYFVNNNFKSLDQPKIESLERFNQVFGSATTMGENGKPTPIDFEKNYAIAVILPETDQETKFSDVSLLKDDKGDITLSYKVQVAQKQSFTTRPAFVVVVDKKENGPIVLKKL